MTKRITLKRIAFYVGLVVVWQLIFSSHVLSEQVIPSPFEVGKALFTGVQDGSLVYGIATSLWRLIVGLAIAISVGTVLGIFIARYETVNQTIGSLLLGLQSIPSVAWVPLAFLWFGKTDGGVIFVTAIGALFAVAINTHSGIKSVPLEFIAAGKNMGASGLQLITNVILPASFPHLISGFKQGWAYAWRGVISAEVIFAVLGLGSLLNLGTKENHISQVIAILIVIMFIGILVDGFVFKKLERSVMSKWGPR